MYRYAFDCIRTGGSHHLPEGRWEPRDMSVWKLDLRAAFALQQIELDTRPAWVHCSERKNRKLWESTAGILPSARR